MERRNDRIVDRDLRWQTTVLRTGEFEPTGVGTQHLASLANLFSARLRLKKKKKKRLGCGSKRASSEAQSIIMLHSSIYIWSPRGKKKGKSRTEVARCTALVAFSFFFFAANVWMGTSVVLSWAAGRDGVTVE